MEKRLCYCKFLFNFPINDLVNLTGRGITAVCVKLVYKSEAAHKFETQLYFNYLSNLISGLVSDGHVNRFCGKKVHSEHNSTSSDGDGSCENTNLSNYGVDSCLTCNENMCNSGSRAKVNFVVFTMVSLIIGWRRLSFVEWLRSW